MTAVAMLQVMYAIRIMQVMGGGSKRIMHRVRTTARFQGDSP